jgi:hypothetical protein
METTPGASPSAEAARRLDRELGLVSDAIALVASGSMPRVVVAGLRLSRVVLPEAERLADLAGVRIVPLWTTDEQQFDLRVERKVDRDQGPEGTTR